MLGVYRRVQPLAPSPAALSSPPWSAPLHAALHGTLHHTPRCTPAALQNLPQVGLNLIALLWVYGVKHQGMAVGWMDGQPHV